MAETSLMYERFHFYFVWFRCCSVHIPSKEPPRMYTLFAVVAFVHSMWHLSAMLIDLIHFLHDLEHFMETIRLFVPGIGAFYTVLFLRFQRKSLEKLMLYADNFTWDERVPYSEEFAITWVLPRIKPLTMIVYWGAMLFHLVYCIIRLSFRDDRPLTVNTVYGFDTSPSPLYEVLNILQYLFGCWVILPFFGFPSLFAYLVAIACSQLEKLRANLKKVNQEKNCHEQIRECIRHHQMILQYMRDMEQITNKELMGQFTLILGGMCCASFSCAMSWGNVLQMSQCVVAYTGFMVQLYAYCWIGNELTRQAESIRDAAWECDWVGAPIPTQKNVTFLIAMATKDFILTAGKFVPVSRNTMMNVVNQTISYLMFLMQVKDKE